MKLKRKLYLCQISAEYELFETPTVLYPSLKALKKKHKMWKECGIVEIILTGKVIVRGKY